MTSRRSIRSYAAVGAALAAVSLGACGSGDGLKPPPPPGQPAATAAADQTGDATGAPTPDPSGDTPTSSGGTSAPTGVDAGIIPVPELGGSVRGTLVSRNPVGNSTTYIVRREDAVAALRTIGTSLAGQGFRSSDGQPPAPDALEWRATRGSTRVELLADRHGGLVVRVWTDSPTSSPSAPTAAPAPAGRVTIPELGFSTAGTMINDTPSAGDASYVFRTPDNTAAYGQLTARLRAQGYTVDVERKIAGGSTQWSGHKASTRVSIMVDAEMITVLISR